MQNVASFSFCTKKAHCLLNIWKDKAYTQTYPCQHPYITSREKQKNAFLSGRTTKSGLRLGYASGPQSKN